MITTLFHSWVRTSW